MNTFETEKHQHREELDQIPSEEDRPTPEPAKAPAGVRRERYRLTDVGVAERFRDQHRDKIRYVPEWRSWIAWDGTRWIRSDASRAYALLKETIRSIDREASEEANDDGRRRDLRKHAMDCERGPKMRSVLALAAMEEGIPHAG